MSGYGNRDLRSTPSRHVLTQDLGTALEEGKLETDNQQLRALGTEAPANHKVLMEDNEFQPRVNELLSGTESLSCRQLEQVMELSDDAAHRTLNAAEQALLHLNAILKGTVTTDNNKQAGNINHHIEVLRDELNKIIMAQQYQDLSGQIIKRVITLLTDIESQFAGSQRYTEWRSENIRKNANRYDKGHGPGSAGNSGNREMANQDEVDDLLESLGI